MSVWKCCLSGPRDEPKSNGIVTQLVRFGKDATSILLTYTDKHTHFLSHSKTNTLSLHYTCRLYLPLIVPVHLSLVHLFHFASLYTIFLSKYNVYLSLHLCPSESSPALGLCPFIIHEVVLMAQAAMSDVNLCTSKAHCLRRISQEGYCSSYCAQVPYNTKSTRSITPGSYSTCKSSAFV